MTANKLYFVQHGLAVNKNDNPGRPLSDNGIKQTTAVARQLHNSDVSVSGIFHSGKLRAQQTAEIFASILNIQNVAATGYLSPNDDITLIEQQLNIEQALYVGHLPHLEKLTASLVTANESPAVIRFLNSAVVCLEKCDSLYRVAWYLTPRLVNTQ